MSDAPPYFIGHWKFSQQVPFDQLAALARQWSQHDAHYLHLAVRTLSPERVAIVFAYQLPAHLVRDAAYEHFLTTIDRKLKQTFGELYNGFDIDCQGTMIK